MDEKHFCLDDSPAFRWLEMDEVTSTNDFLKAYRPGGERRMTLVTAEHQTAGRGAGSNHWVSAPGQNLLFSLLVHPRHIGPERLFVLSEALALAIREAVANEELRIKWPNDIYCGDRKLCGMLIENELCGSTVERCIMGVGLNVNQTDFGDGAPNPVSLAQLAGREVERRFVLERVVQAFDKYYRWTEEGRAEDIHRLYLTYLYRKGSPHMFADRHGPFRGTILGVEPDGHLIIADEAGEHRSYAFKELEYMGIGVGNECE